MKIDLVFVYIMVLFFTTGCLHMSNFKKVSLFLFHFHNVFYINLTLGQESISVQRKEKMWKNKQNT